MWRDISTAPKDGTSVLILLDGVVHQASYDGPSDGAVYSFTRGVYNWFSESENHTHHDRLITHWMPLPPPPEDAALSGRTGSEAYTAEGNASRDEPNLLAQRATQESENG